MRGFFLLWCGLSWLGLTDPCSALVQVPRLAARVTDQTGTLTSDQLSAIEKRLQEFEASKGSQVSLLVVATTNPESIEQYALRVVEVWKIGRKGVDDGVLLLVAKQDRTVRIEVGYGLEGALPDVTAKRIIEEVIVPRFRQGDYDAGISEGLDRIMKVIEGEPLPPPSQAAGSGAEKLPFFVFGALIAGSVLRSLMGRVLGATVGGVAAAILVWLTMGLLLVGGLFGLFVFLMILFGNTRGGGHRSGGGSSFGGSSHSSGGGGFSGGGGSFGGGGASGRW